MRKLRILASCLIVCLLASMGCSRINRSSNDPKQRLTEYISRSFSVKSPGDRMSMLEYLTGDSKRRLSAWSDEQFGEAFIDSKREFIKLSFREVKSVSPDEMNITYELTYLDQGKGNDAKVTHKKLCRLVKEQGKWLISDVKNIKELVEYKNEMSLP